jgi:pilus assembly protein CpaC
MNRKKSILIAILAALLVMPSPGFSQNSAQVGINPAAPQMPATVTNDDDQHKTPDMIKTPPVRYLQWTGYDQEKNETLYIVTGTSQVFRFDRPVARISISRPEICDALPLGTQEILMHAQGVGKMNLIVWDTQYNTTSYNLISIIDIYQLREILMGIDPKAELKILPYNDSVAIFGTTTNAQTLAQINAAASKIQGGIQSFVEIKNPKQILLEVRLAEVDRTASEYYGVDNLSLLVKNGKNASFGLGEAFSAIGDPTRDPNFGLTFATNTQEYNVNLQWLIDKGIAKIVARPNLLAKDGQEASFFVGGEFPIPTYTQNDGDVYISVTYKDYGTKLTFTPRVINNDVINLQITTELSEIDEAHTVTISDNLSAVPGTLNRTHKTVAELKDNEMLVIGGMVTQRIGETHTKIPILGDIPVIEKFFKGTTYRRTDLDLLVIIVPHLITPTPLASNSKDYITPESGKKINKHMGVFTGPFDDPQGDAIREVVTQNEKLQNFPTLDKSKKEKSSQEPRSISKEPLRLPPPRAKTKINYNEAKNAPVSSESSENIQKIMRREEIVVYS